MPYRTTDEMSNDFALPFPHLRLNGVGPVSREEMQELVDRVQRNQDALMRMLQQIENRLSGGSL